MALVKSWKSKFSFVRIESERDKLGKRSWKSNSRQRWLTFCPWISWFLLSVVSCCYILVGPTAATAWRISSYFTHLLHYQTQRTAAQQHCSKRLDDYTTTITTYKKRKINFEKLLFGHFAWHMSKLVHVRAQLLCGQWLNLFFFYLFLLPNCSTHKKTHNKNLLHSRLVDDAIFNVPHSTKAKHTHSTTHCKAIGSISASGEPSKWHRSCTLIGRRI